MTNLEERIVEIGEKYLGFAAKTYLDRQCRLHLEKSLEELEPDDLDQLALWVKNTSPLIMNEEEGAELAEELYALRHDYKADEERSENPLQQESTVSVEQKE